MIRDSLGAQIKLSVIPRVKQDLNWLFLIIETTFKTFVITALASATGEKDTPRRRGAKPPDSIEQGAKPPVR